MSLILIPATLRRWAGGHRPIRVSGLPTEFGNLDLLVQTQSGARQIDDRFKLTPGVINPSGL